MAKTPEERIVDLSLRFAKADYEAGIAERRLQVVEQELKSAMHAAATLRELLAEHNTWHNNQGTVVHYDPKTGNTFSIDATEAYQLSELGAKTANLLNDTARYADQYNERLQTLLNLLKRNVAYLAEHDTTGEYVFGELYKETSQALVEESQR